MGAKGYCNAGDVADFLGVTLTSAQEARAMGLLETVEALVDGATGRSWLTGPVEDETLRPADWPDGRLYLRCTPVTTIDEVRGRAGFGEAETVLVADTDYEVLDLAGGVIRLVDPCAYDRIRVDYTPVATVPAPVRDGAAEWVAALLQPTLRPDTFGVESFSLPDLSVKFAKGATDPGGPTGALAKLAAIDPYPDLPGVA